MALWQTLCHGDTPMYYVAIRKVNEPQLAQQSRANPINAYSSSLQQESVSDVTHAKSFENFRWLFVNEASVGFLRRAAWFAAFGQPAWLEGHATKYSTMAFITTHNTHTHTHTQTTKNEATYYTRVR